MSPLLPLRKQPSASKSPPFREARSILVLRLDSIGDLVLTSPFLRELRRPNPAAWISLAVDSRFANLVALCPYVNEIVPIDSRSSGAMSRLRLHGRAFRNAWALRNRRFDAALVPRWDADEYHASFFAYFTCAHCRVAYSESVSPRKRLLNRGFDTLFTRVLPFSEARHEVERSLDLLRAMGIETHDDRLELWLADEDRAFAKRVLHQHGIGARDLIVAIAPGAAAPKRIWPLSRFIELARLLHNELSARILIVGGPEDRQLGAYICDALGLAAANFAGETTLRQTGAILERAQLAIANDSGPMHLAAAAGIPVVGISCHPKGGDPFHANSPVRFRPWTPESIVLQPSRPIAPCTTACDSREAHCILEVTTKAVWNAAKMLVSRVRQSEKSVAVEGRHAI